MTNNFSPAIKAEPDDDGFFFPNLGAISDSTNDRDLYAFAPSLSGQTGGFTGQTPSLDARSSAHLSSSYLGGSAGFGDQELLGSLLGVNGNHEQFMPNYRPSAGNSNGMQITANPVNEFGQSAPDRFYGQQVNGHRAVHRQGGLPYSTHHDLSPDEKKPPADARSYQHSPMGNGAQGITHTPDTMYSPRSDYGRAAPMAMSPRHPQIAALQQYGTSDTSSHGSLPITHHRHRSSSGSNWGFSFDGETPLTSPMSVPKVHGTSGPTTTQFSAGLSRSRSNKQKPQSLPSGGHSKDEMKRIKRRQAHNMVEQKRRDKINDRIFELAHLVPSHRLDDSKVRRQQAAHARNGSTSGNIDSTPDIAPLRRNGTAVQLNQGNSVEERDQTKGNALENAVKWTRDLMWLLERKIAQENVLIQTLSENNIDLPYDIKDDELRMAHELMLAMAQNHDQENPFVYSRKDGSGLHVPHYTDASGQKTTDDFADSRNQLRDYQDAAPTAGGCDGYSDPDSNGWMGSPNFSDQYHFDVIDESPMERMEI